MKSRISRARQKKAAAAERVAYSVQRVTKKGRGLRVKGRVKCNGFRNPGFLMSSFFSSLRHLDTQALLILSLVTSVLSQKLLYDVAHSFPRGLLPSRAGKKQCHCEASLASRGNQRLRTSFIFESSQRKIAASASPPRDDVIRGFRHLILFRA